MKVFTESRENRMQMDKHLEGRPPMPHEHDFLMSVMADPFLPMRGEQ